jgi:hypothetical protein
VRALAVAAVTFAALAAAPAARAQTFTVDGTADTPSGAPCSLDVCPSIRAALSAAGQSVGADTIVIGPGDYQLDQGKLLIDTPVTLAGAGARSTIVRGRAAFRVVEVAAGVEATITGLTLRDGTADNTSSFRPGGDVVNSGTLTLDRVTIAGGHASSGGGVANTSGTLSITRSAIVGNFADIGGADSGGILNFGGGTLTVSDSTIAGNRASLAGALLSWGGSAGAPNRTTLTRVTVAGNVATARGIGGLGHDTVDSLTATGSIVAGNTFAQQPSNCDTPLTSGGGNVESGTDCGFTSTGDLQNTDPQLATAPDQTGPTDVYPIAATSPAVDRFACTGADQRGVARPQGSACDAGAYELAVAGGTDPSPGATPLPATPTPTVTPTPVPTPQYGRSAVATPSGGTVRVRVPGSNRYVVLSTTTTIPFGSLLDTRHGRIQLSSQPKPGAAPQQATFYDGLFKLTQTRGITTLTLVEALAPCPKHAAAAAKRPKTRRLWGNGSGSFRTQGRYSAATVRGTKWLVQDSCSGTLTRVAKGVVTVRDSVRRRTIVVRAGHHYLARPRR